MAESGKYRMVPRDNSRTGLPQSSLGQLWCRHLLRVYSVHGGRRSRHLPRPPAFLLFGDASSSRTGGQAMSPRESGFGKPKWKREPREIAASSAAPELSQQTPEPFCADNSEPSDGWQSRPGADVGLTELGGDWRKRRNGGFHKHDVPRLVLSERQWRRVARFLTGKRGDPGRTAEDNRRTLEGIIWIFRTGAPWRDLPAYFGKWNSVYRTFKRWSRLCTKAR